VKLAGSAADLKYIAGRAAHGDARRIVAAVLQTPQAFDDDWNYFFRTDITDDSAHASILSDDADKTM
jgi:hypothetical protein